MNDSMQIKRNDHGKKGEEIAAAWLKNEGYTIMARNWYCGHQEIDIIAKQGEQIVIVEVKSRNEDYLEEPWEAVSAAKIRNIVQAADAWLIQEKVDLETRFDVISVVFLKDGSHELTHFQDAFTPPVN